MWIEGLAGALTPENLLFLVLGSLWGMFIGVLPALGCNFAVALMLPFTFGMNPATAMIFLCAAHVATNHGDSLASILIGIPGGPGTVATTWDGHAMARNAQPGRALGIATLGSFIGGVITWLSLVLLTKPLADMAMIVGAPEYFALGVMALSLVAVASKGETIKGLVLVSLGLLLSSIGQDPYAGETYRFSFGIWWLEDGLDVVTVTLGVFAIAEIIRLLEEKTIVHSGPTMQVKDSIFTGFVDVLRRPATVARAGGIGWFVGILPALGISLAGIASYLFEKNYSKEKADFGKGSPGGVLAAEVGKGACVIGDLIPSFLLGVPGSVTGAILMAALIIHGVDPGPRFLKEGVLPYVVFSGLLLALFAYLIIGPMVCKLMARLIFLPNAILAPLIAVLTILGTYMQRNQAVDLFIVVFFGVVAYALDKVRFPLVCLVLGLILGPLVEANLARSLGITFGSPSVFLQRPLALAMFAITALFLAGPYVRDFIPFLKRVKLPGTEAPREEKAETREIVTLAVISLVIAAFLGVTATYPFKAQLFPMMVGIPGLVLAVSRLGALLWQRRREQGAVWSAEPFRGVAERPVVPFALSMALMAGYAVATSVVGLVPATVLFVLGTAFVAGFRRPWLLAGMSLGTGVFSALFLDLLQVPLPMGIIYDALFG